MSGPPPALVSTEWLAARIGGPGIRVLDASWYLPSSGRNAEAEYEAGHIPGAVFFNLDESSDPDSTLPHMLPSAERFAGRMSALGLLDTDELVIYDGSGVNLSAARSWWMFRVFGHNRVAVLDGGIGKWRREGRRLEAGPVRLPPGRYSARLGMGKVRELEDVRRALELGSEQVVDLRSSGRYLGTEPEPRAGLRGGHMPGSINLPFQELVTDEGTLPELELLRRKIEVAGVDLSRPVVATCGSGTSACALIFALHLLGHDDVSLYDGAWTEWASRADTPVVAGSSK